MSGYLMILIQKRKDNLSIYSNRPFTGKCNMCKLPISSFIAVIRPHLYSTGRFFTTQFFLLSFGLAGGVSLRLKVNQIKMLCHTAEHLVYAVMPPKSIPILDRVLYNNNISDKITQENHVFAQLLDSL